MIKFQILAPEIRTGSRVWPFRNSLKCPVESPKRRLVIDNPIYLKLRETIIVLVQNSREVPFDGVTFLF